MEKTFKINRLWLLQIGFAYTVMFIYLSTMCVLFFIGLLYSKTGIDYTICFSILVGCKLGIWAFKDALESEAISIKVKENQVTIKSPVSTDSYNLLRCKLKPISQLNKTEFYGRMGFVLETPEREYVFQPPYFDVKSMGALFAQSGVQLPSEKIAHSDFLATIGP